MRACLVVTLCLVAGGLAGCALTAAPQTAKQASSCLQDVKSSPEGQVGSSPLRGQAIRARQTLLSINCVIFLQRVRSLPFESTRPAART
jgi:hypothetical protein